MNENELIKAEHDLLSYFRRCNDLQKRFIISTALDCAVSLKMYEDECKKRRQSIEIKSKNGGAEE